MAVDGQGRPMRFILTGGQRNDITQAPALLAGFKPKCVLADKGHDSRQLVAQIHSLGAQPVNPPRSCQQPRAYDKALYRLRNRIERCFARLKPFRRIATRFDRKPSLLHGARHPPLPRLAPQIRPATIPARFKGRESVCHLAVKRKSQEIGMGRKAQKASVSAFSRPQTACEQLKAGETPP